MLLPMVARGRTMGVLSIVAGPDRPPFTPPDLDLYADLARRAAVALDNARLFGQRSRIASRLQESLLPAELPVVAGLDLAVRYVTAEEAVDVGGDFYDVFPTGPDEWLVVIGDVAGRGVDAAGVTGLARQTLRAIGHDLGPGAALGRLNDLLYAQQAVERFLTAACGRLTRRGDGTFGLTLACGGHALPLLRRADGHAEPVGEPGTLLGAMPSVDCPETRHVLGPGDTLLLYTDGVVEARGPQGLFGEERLARVVTTCPAGGADAFAACVERAVVDYRSGGAADDLALLVVQVNGDG
jgi:serine phosphatase RsbU (regulator of sigma subunit)